MCATTHSWFVTCLSHVCNMTHSYMWHDASTCVIYKWIMSHIQMTSISLHLHEWNWMNTSTCVIWFIHVSDMLVIRMCDMIHLYDKDSFVWVTCLICMRNMTHLHVWHASVMCATWLIYICDMPQSRVHHDSFMCVTWCLPMSDMPHSYVWHASLTFLPRVIHMCDMPWVIHIYDMPQLYMYPSATSCVHQNREEKAFHSRWNTCVPPKVKHLHQRCNTFFKERRCFTETPWATA